MPADTPTLDSAVEVAHLQAVVRRLGMRIAQLEIEAAEWSARYEQAAAQQVRTESA